MCGHCLLERTVDVTARGLTLADTLEPLADVQVSRVVTLAVHVGVKQASLGEVKLRRRGDRVGTVLSRHVGVERRVGRDDALLDLFRIACRILVDGDGEDVGYLHRGVVAHEDLSAVTAAGESRAVEHRQILIRPFKCRLEHVGHGSSVLEEIDTSG